MGDQNINAEDFIAGTSIAPYYDVAVGDDYYSKQLRDAYNGGQPFAMAVIDTDTRDMAVAGEVIAFPTLLHQVYNNLAIGGAIIVDDVGWAHREEPTSFHMRNGLEMFLANIRDIVLGGTAYDLLDTTNPVYHVVNYDAAGNPLNLTDYGPNVVLTSLGNLPVLEYHDVWNTGHPWMAVFRKDIPTDPDGILLSFMIRT